MTPEEKEWLDEFGKRVVRQAELTGKRQLPKGTTLRSVLTVIGTTVALVLGAGALLGYLLMPRAEAIEEHNSLKEIHDKDMTDAVELITENTVVNRIQQYQINELEKKAKDFQEHLRRRK